MFQDALVESSGSFKTNKKSLNFLATLLNAFFLTGLILWPLLHPLALPQQTLTRLLVAPAPPSAPPAHATVVRRSLRATEPLIAQMEAPSVIPRTINSAPDTAPSPLNGVFKQSGMPGGSTGASGDVIDSIGLEPIPPVKLQAQRKMSISSGVMAGNKITGEMPVYSAIAKEARVQGTVTLQATISKSGTIENLRVLDGPAMLAASAVQAVSTWRYHPYLLNGEPVEVETTINVVFNLSN